MNRSSLSRRSLFRRSAAGAALGCAALMAAVVVPSQAQAAQPAGRTYIAAGQNLAGSARASCRA